LDDLVREIIGHLSQMPPAGGGRPPRLDSDLEKIVTPAERATPVALFLNEALTNAIKHGGATGAGRVTVTLRAQEAGGFTIAVANAAAAPAVPTEGKSRPNSIGVSLMESFARQLRGVLAREVADGLHVVSLTVPPLDPDAQPDVAAGI
jgi:two-component sensor histidine kinase